MAQNIRVTSGDMTSAASKHESIGSQISMLEGQLGGAITSQDTFGTIWWADNFYNSYSKRLDTARQCLSALGDLTVKHGETVSTHNAAFSTADQESASAGNAVNDAL